MSEENNNSEPEKKKVFDENIEELWALRRPKKEKPFWLKKDFLVSTVIIIVIGLCVWDIIDAPPIWHFRQRDKRAIMQYQRANYPGAKVKDRYFPFFANEKIVGTHTPSRITFEYEGITFKVSAWDGEILGDGYLFCKSEKPIKDKLWGYLTPKKIKPDFSSIDIDFDELDPPEKLSEYKNVEIRFGFKRQTVDPRNEEWLFDFYEYWQTYSGLPDYEVEIVYIISNDLLYSLTFDNESDLDREEFYSSFKIDELN